MKYFILILFFIFSNPIFANDENNGNVELINLYESKSLDQMVLDNLNEQEIEEVAENFDETAEIELNTVEVKQIEIIRDNFVHKNELKDLKNYFEHLQKINSKTLKNELVKVLENIQLDFEVEKDKEIFFLVNDYLQSIGQINKSYELIEKYQFTKEKNSSFYTELKFNYLLSTFQLNEACNLKEELNLNIKLNFFFLEKLDIFCLILNDNKSEASLLNSILLESEVNIDNYFQHLFSL